MNILVSGLLWSGSSAVIDMLREYDEVGVMPGEFDEFRRPGMVADHLAGRISAQYPSRLATTQFGLQTLTRQAIKGNFRNFKPEMIRRRASSRRLGSVLKNSGSSFSEKLSATRAWLAELRQIHCPGKRLLAIDQPILFGQHLDIWPQVFTPFKLLVIYRDPRDQLAQIIKQGHLFFHMRSPTADMYGGDRLGAIRFQIDTLKVRLALVDRIQDTHGPDNVMTLSFERLISEHAAVRRQLERWLGLAPTANANTILKPSESSKNIGIYSTHLHPDELELLSDLYDDYRRRADIETFS